MNSAGKYLTQLFSATGELKLVKTKPTEIVKELLLKEALDKDMYLTDKEETNAQPSFTPTPTITPSEPKKIDPNSDSIKSLSEIFENWVAKDFTFMDQVVEANKTNYVRI